MGESKRADILLVERGYFESRARARAAIEAGLVAADGARVAKPASLIDAEAAIEASAAHPYVSRGGVKLAAGLDAFAIAPAARVCLDVGASTGGFSDVLLRRGAAKVFAIDVGHGQLHPRLRSEARLVSLEGTDIRALDPAALDDAPSLVAIDVSFISLVLILPAVSRLASPKAQLVALVKPQFEMGRGGTQKGIVRDGASHERACAGVEDAVRALGWSVTGRVPSPIAGGDGNREFLVGARRG